MKTPPITAVILAMRLLLIGCFDTKDQCVRYFVPVDQSLKKVFLETGSGRSLDILHACQDQYPGHGLLTRYSNFTREDTQICGGDLVPFGIINQYWIDLLGKEDGLVTEAEWKLLKYKGPLIDFQSNLYGYFNMTSRTLTMREYYGVISNCGVCQQEKIYHLDEFSLDGSTKMGDWENDLVFHVKLCIVSKEVITDPGWIEPKGLVMDRIRKELKDLYEMRKYVSHVKLFDSVINTDGLGVLNVEVKILRLRSSNLEYGHQDFRFVVGAEPFKLPSFESVTMVEDLSLCTTTGDLFGNPSIIETRRAISKDGWTYMTFNGITHDVTMFKCVYNKLSHHTEWQPQLDFTTSWRPCEYKDVYVPIRVKLMNYAKKIETYSKQPITIGTLKLLLDRLPTFIYYGPHTEVIIGDSYTKIDRIAKVSCICRFWITIGVWGNIETILSNFTPDKNFVDLKSGDWRESMFFLTNLDTQYPVRGIYKNESDSKFGSIITRTVLPANISSVFITVSISDDLIREFDMMAVLNYNTSKSEHSGEYAHFEDDNLNSQNEIVQLFAITFFKNSSESFIYADDTHHFIDFIFSVHVLPDNFSELIASWDFERNSWNTDDCKLQKTTFYSNIVYRCKHLSAKRNMLHGYYIMYNSIAHTSDILSLRLSLKIILAFEVVLSTFGVISIFLTAILFKQWRKDLGHQVMLQMTAALLFNLILGFTCSLIRLDIMTIHCAVIGALRHYSFLAMFLWMLTLSYLQYRRLTTVAGASTTTHLLMKVSLFAWGLPLLPVATLLAWDYERFYMTRSVDRGYCYPDGTALIVTVMAPAVLVLVLNFLCFVYILNTIYKCVGHGKQIQRFGLSERKAQLRNLGTSVFIFFLFGFSWLFNILSETEVIKNQTFFDYLFLVTATFHVSMLSLFFVFFEKKTRGYWMKLFGMRTSVQSQQSRTTKMSSVSVDAIVARKRAEIKARIARNKAAAAARARKVSALAQSQDNVIVEVALDDTVLVEPVHDSKVPSM